MYSGFFFRGLLFFYWCLLLLFFFKKLLILLLLCFFCGGRGGLCVYWVFKVLGGLLGFIVSLWFRVRSFWVKFFGVSRGFKGFR